jgi:hypothetical protein
MPANVRVMPARSVPLDALPETRRMPAPVVPVTRTNIVFQIENRARRRHQAAIFRKRRPRYVAVFRQLSVKVIGLTRTILVA